MSRGRFSTAGLTLGTGYLIENALVFLRTVVVARLLGPEFFGISVTFLLVVSTFALISDLGIEKYLVQVRESEVEGTMPTLATILLIRGVMMAAIILLLANWIAQRFGNPQLGWFYAAAAAIPLIEGLRHLDPLRQQRAMRFAPSVKMQLGGLIPGVLLTIALAAITHSYVAIVAGSIATSVISVALSHLLARERYRLGLDRGALRAVLIYGWPLLLNGGVIFLAMQGDRIVIATLRGMTDLAGYVAMAALTSGASVFVARLFGNLSLPLLSEAREDARFYAERCRTTGAAALLMLSSAILPFGIIGAPLVMLLFGDAYRTPQLLAAFLAIQAAAAVVRAWAVCISLSLGGTNDILLNNILRITGLIGAIVAVSAGYGLEWVAAAMCAGDVAATYLALFQVRRRTDAALRPALVIGGTFLLLAGLVLATQALIDPFASWLVTVLAAAVSSAIGIIAGLLASAELRARLINGARQLLRRASRKVG
jgi:O-antigen/teichoic acid export membrane protein